MTLAPVYHLKDADYDPPRELGYVAFKTQLLTFLAVELRDSRFSVEDDRLQRDVAIVYLEPTAPQIACFRVHRREWQEHIDDEGWEWIRERIAEAMRRLTS